MRLATGRRSETFWLAAVLALALATRLYASVGFDGHAWTVAGCDAPFVEQIEPIVATGNPLHFDVFWYPPVPAIVTAGAIGVWRALGGGVDTASQCRAVGVGASLATVTVVYMLGRLWGRRHAVIAAALYAVAMISVVVLGNPQVYSALFVSLALYSILRAERDGTVAPLVLAGVWLGLGVASKYTPGFFAAVLFAPYVCRRWAAWRERAAVVMPRDAESVRGRRLASLWTMSVATLVALTVAALWLGIAERDRVYDLLRSVYARQPHDNPFDYHLPWIDRAYRASLALVGLTGGLGGLALVIPWMQRVPSARWAARFFERHRLWIVPGAAFVATIVAAVGIPALLNLGTFAKYAVGMAKLRRTGDYGFFPEHRPAVSYIAGFIPENLGLPLFVAGLIGLLYVLARRDKKAAILVVGAVPAYLMLEMTRVKVNRFGLELAPLWCLLAAIWLGDLVQHARHVTRAVGRVAVAAILVTSLIYSLAWAELASPRGDVRDAAGKWLSETIPHGASIGARSRLIVTGSPELLPDARWLAGYRVVDYTDDPDYVLLPNGVYAIVVQYLASLNEGYVYTADDWYSATPTPADLAALSRIVREDGYVLAKDFHRRPTVLGLPFGSHALSGPTWTIEHSAAAGLRVYRRAGARG